MAKKHTLADIVTERFDCEECRKSVLESIADNGTEKRIMKGELVLPTPHSAHTTHLREEAEAKRKAELAQKVEE